MTNPSDLRVLDRIRQHMVWQTVIAAEKAAIAVFAAKNRKRRQPVTADDSVDPLDLDPLKTTDVDQHLDRFDTSLLDLDTDEIDAALMPFVPITAMDRDAFLAAVDRVAKDHKDDPLLASFDSAALKGLLFNLAAARLQIAKQRQNLTNKGYLSSLGFDAALAEYEDFSENIGQYNTYLQQAKQAGLDLSAVAGLQTKVSVNEIRSMLSHEQARLQAMLDRVKDGRSLGAVVDRKELERFRHQNQQKIDEYKTVAQELKKVLSQRNRLTGEVYWDKIPEDIKLANRKLGELRAVADKRAFESGNVLYQREAELEDKLAQVRQQLADVLQPKEASVAWFSDLLMNPPTDVSEDIKALIEEGNDLDEQILDLQEQIKKDDGWSVSDEEPEEDVVLNQQIETYRQEVYQYLEQTFGISEERLTTLDTSETTDLLEAFKSSDRNPDPEPITVKLNGEKVVVTDNDEIEALLEKIESELSAVDDTDTLLSDPDRQQELINQQIAHVENLKENLLAVDLKRLLMPARMSKEELQFFRFIKAAVVAERERKRLLANGDVDDTALTDPDISFAMYKADEPIDSAALLKAYQTGSFEDMKYVAPQLHNVRLDALRTTRADYDLFKRMPIDELLKKTTKVTAAKLGVKERLLTQVNERIAAADRFNQLHNGGLTYDEAQLRAAELRAQLDLVESNIELIDKALATKVPLPVPDPKITSAYVPFVQGMKKAVRFEPVRVGNTDTIKVELVDFDAVPTPVTVQAPTPPDDDSIPLFVDYDPYMEMENLLRQKEAAPVGRLGTVQSAAIDVVIRSILTQASIHSVLAENSFLDGFKPSPEGTTMTDSKDIAFGVGSVLTVTYGNVSNTVQVLSIRQNDEGMKVAEVKNLDTNTTNFVFQPQIDDSTLEVTVKSEPTMDAPVEPPVTVVGLQDAKGNPVSVGDTGTYMGDPVTVTKIGVDQIEMERETLTAHLVAKVTVGNFQSNFIKGPLPSSAPVEQTKEVPEITTTPPVKNAGSAFVDAKGTPVKVGDKVNIGGLQEAVIKRLFDKGMEVQTSLPSQDGKPRFQNQVITWPDVTLLNVVRVAAAGVVAAPLKATPISNMKPAFLNPVVLQKLQAVGMDMTPFYRVNMALPENAALRDSLIRMVLAYIDAHRDDPDARKLLACIPLKSEKGKMTPALIDRLVSLGYKREQVEGWSETTARAMLIHQNFHPDSMDGATKAALKQLGWTDADISGMTAMQAMMYLGHKIRRPTESEEASVKAAKLKETVTANPVLLDGLQPQATVVEMQKALRNTANKLRAEIKFAESVQVADTTQYIRIRDQLTKQISDLRSSLNTALDVGRVKDIPGLTPREARYHSALVSVLGVLREAMNSYKAQGATDPEARKFVNQLRVDVESYQTEINQLNRKSNNFKAQQNVDNYVANDANKARRLGLGLPTLEQFEDRVIPTYDKPQYEIDIVPRSVAPEDHLNVRLTTPVKEPKPKSEKPKQGRSAPASGHSKKGPHKPNLRVRKFMKLDDFLKQTR